MAVACCCQRPITIHIKDMLCFLLPATRAVVVCVDSFYCARNWSFFWRGSDKYKGCAQSGVQIQLSLFTFFDLLFTIGRC